MKVVVLGAGHGTRLERDLNSHGDQYNHLRGVPKLLLPIGGKPLLTRWLEIFESTHLITHLYIGTNDKFLKQLESWRDALPSTMTIKCLIVSDGTTSNEDRLGAVSCIQFVAQKFQLEHEHVLVMAGDLLFKKGFDLSSLFKYFFNLKSSQPYASLVASYKCLEQDVSRHGILELVGENKKVKELLEKPSTEKTSSRNACPCFYILSPQALKEITNFLDETQELPLDKRDAPGNFIKYLVQKQDVYAFEVSSGRFDVGNLKSYIECNSYFCQ